MDNPIYAVLFLCTNNVVRSIMAESILHRRGQERFQAYSAGSQPSGVVHPYARDLLEQHQYPTTPLRSKSWNEFTGSTALPLHFVFTLSEEVAQATAPVWPGQPLTTHWGLPAPVAVEGDETVKRAAFAATLQRLEQRITRFVNLPLQSLDRPTLHQQLIIIGASPPRVIRETLDSEQIQMNWLTV